MLWAAAEITGYQGGRSACFKQWQQIGAQVRRGEKGTPVVFYKELPRRGGDAAAGGPKLSKKGHPPQIRTLWRGREENCVAQVNAGAQPLGLLSPPAEAHQTVTLDK